MNCSQYYVYVSIVSICACDGSIVSFGYSYYTLLAKIYIIQIKINKLHVQTNLLSNMIDDE